MNTPDQVLTEAIARALERSEATLIEQGATDAEIEAEMAILNAQLRACRISMRAEIERGLSDWDAPSGKLQ